MPDVYYKEALKLAQKEYRNSLTKGLSPCLPVLDDFLSGEKTSTGIDLGLVQIPIDKIVGTKSRGRVNAFAPNFMPILEDGTEFSVKWKHLCSAHLNEGIHDPIKAYEYMNRFYVEEGNKRVSVLKFFGAVNVPGIVTRILPERNGEEEVELYYEFVNFYKLSKINDIEFSKRGSYASLQKLLGKEPDEEWNEDEQKQFSATYHYFEQAYISAGGNKLSSTVGDAMLSYIKVYGYPELCVTETADIKKKLKVIWEDVALQDEQEPIELKLDPAEEKKPHMLKVVLPIVSPSILKVAFLYDGTPERSGWVHDHEKGRLHIQRIFDDKIETKAYPNVMENDPLEVIEQAIEDGAKLIFTTTPRLMQASLRAAVEHPDILIMNCSLNKSHRYIRSYYTRMYEAKFILGALAGSLSESGKLGYVCDYPIFGQIAGINAFALGAQMANPRSKVHIEWSSIKGAKEAAQALAEKGIHYISSQDTARFMMDNRDSYGLSYIHQDKLELLATPVWKWGAYYEAILRRVFDKTLKAEYESSSKALNYYWGMSAGVVDILYSDALPTASRRFADFLKESIVHNVCAPFITPLITQSGEVIGEGEKSLSLEQIINMDYLVENVIGSIPKYEELNPMGKATVDMVGIEKSQNTSIKEDEDAAKEDGEEE